ncbi:hypothetical protein ES705_50177 [subsurface metagenome]
MDIFAFSNTFNEVTPGIVAIPLGCPAAMACATMLANGLILNSSAFSLDISIIEAAPVLRPGAFPAVTVGLLYTVGNFDNFSKLVSGLGPSSSLIIIVPICFPLFIFGISKGIISSLNLPSANALAYNC